MELNIRSIPQGIKERHKELVVCFDVMHVNGIPFAVLISRAIKLGTVEALANRKASTLLISIKTIKATYERRGFLTNRLVVDNEFNSLDTPRPVMGIGLNTVARDEHVTEVERFIRTQKEWFRVVVNTLQFRLLPNHVVIELVYAMNLWLHALTARVGVSAHMSPRELVTGKIIYVNKHCVVPFGAYVQKHEQHDNSNSRTIGALALRSTGNAQGGHYFYSLMTGQRIVRNHWTVVTMTADVI